jgi:hypothetical protein
MKRDLGIFVWMWAAVLGNAAFAAWEGRWINATGVVMAGLSLTFLAFLIRRREKRCCSGGQPGKVTVTIMGDPVQVKEFKKFDGRFDISSEPDALDLNGKIQRARALLVAAAAEHLAGCQTPDCMAMGRILAKIAIDLQVSAREMRFLPALIVDERMACNCEGCRPKKLEPAKEGA